MIFSYILLYICVWWIILYTTLPFSVKTSNAPKVGLADSAPEKTNLGIKFTVTSIISFIITYLIVVIIENGYLKSLIEKYLSIIGL